MSLIKERYYTCDVCGKKMDDNETRYTFLVTDTGEIETLLGFTFVGEKAEKLDMCPKCMMLFRSFVRRENEKEDDNGS